MNEYEELLKTGLSTLKINYTKECINNFSSYLKSYIKWNSITNISSIRDKREIIIKHFLDSIAPINILDEFINDGDKIVDLGTGGGFPAIPIKIVRESWDITLAEVNKKKINFLKELISVLKLKNIDILDSSTTKIPPIFDVVISRAFGVFDKNIKESVKYLKPNGIIILYKATDKKINEELEKSKYIKNKKVKFYKKIPINLPFLDAERNLLILKTLFN